MYKLVCFFVFCQLVYCQDVYKAARVDVTDSIQLKDYPSFIHEAAKLHADILVLPTHNSQRDFSKSKDCSRCVDSYDEVIKTVSKAANQYQIYVVTHVYETISCETRQDVVRSNLVFNRNGEIVAVYRKPFNQPNCNATYINTATFNTDFGVTFGLLMEEDLLLKKVEDFGLRNYVVLGASDKSVSYLPSSWAFTTKSNVISAYGVYGNTESKVKGKVTVSELNKYGNVNPVLISSTAYPEDLVQYSIRPLDMERSVNGYSDIVCHEGFCCQFYVKTGRSDDKPNMAYNLIASSGVSKVGLDVVNVQQCAVTTELKRSFAQSAGNSTNVIFEKLSISGNFSSHSTQFPVFVTKSETTMKNIKFQQQNNQKYTQIKSEINDCKDLLRFGIFATDKSETIDYESSNLIDFSEYISSENVQEFFDYLWIRIRVVVFIVSIYILEMM